MRGFGSLVGCCAVVFTLLSVSGCASLEENQRLHAALRRSQADREAMLQEVTDVRTANDSLRTRVTSLERELDTKAELLANLRKENDLLDDLREKTQTALDDMANRQVLGDIAIAGPKLPAQLDNALKQFADQHPTAVVYDPARGTVKWKSDLLFALGSDVVKQSSMEALKGFAEVIMSPAAAEFEVIVAGHTDNTPIVKPATRAKHPSNWHLSAHRAISVASVLANYGYPNNRVSVMGLGEHRPVADNTSDTGKSQNRRVEIYLIPKGVIVQSADGAAMRLSGERVTVKQTP
ncbi:MAG: OmpA family protein [Phycisphaerae bacterium]|jgi:chemotaxis protein MotB